MRVTASISYRNFLDSLDSLNERMDRINLEISSGKKLSGLGDSPSASSELVQLRGKEASLDQYRTNGDETSFFLGIADSVLNSLHNLITAVFTRGSEAASTTGGPDVRATAAREIRSLRDEILSLANTEIRGRHIFAGSSVMEQPFNAVGDTVSYRGNADVNMVSIGDGLEVQQSVPGSSVFSPVFDSVESLVTALDSGDQAGIQAALGSFESVLGSVSEARAQVGTDLAKIQDARTGLEQWSVSIKARRSALEDTNLAEAVTQLTQIQTALKATLAAQSMVRQNNLFDYLG